VWKQFVAGELFLHETVERLIAVERADDIVAVAPRMRTPVISLEAISLREANEVKPRQGLPLAVRRRREQPVQHFLERVGGPVHKEFVHVRGCWREPGQVEGNAAQECGPIRRRSERELRGVQPLEKEAIDGGTGRRIHCRNRRPYWLECPVIRQFSGLNLNGEQQE